MERVDRQWLETLGRNWPNVFLDHGTCYTHANASSTLVLVIILYGEQQA